MSHAGGLMTWHCETSPNWNSDFLLKQGNDSAWSVTEFHLSFRKIPNSKLFKTLSIMERQHKALNGKIFWMTNVILLSIYLVEASEDCLPDVGVSGNLDSVSLVIQTWETRMSNYHVSILYIFSFFWITFQSQWVPMKHKPAVTIS